MTDEPISERVSEVEQIIEQLENSEVSLAEAKDLHTRGQDLLHELEQELDVGTGEVDER